jgi:hypothetical protein
VKILQQILLPVLVIGALSQNIRAQEMKTEEKELSYLHHRIAAILSHSLIPTEDEITDQKKTFIAASLGLNYELWLNNKWAIGLHNDFTIRSMQTEDNAGKTAIERELPALISLVGVYKPWEHWSFFGGPGNEFEKDQNFKVIKTGIEYGIDFPKRW